MTNLWPLAYDVQIPLSNRTRPIMQKIASGYGLDAIQWNSLVTATTYEPETMSAARVQTRFPYNSTDPLDQRLVQLESQGFYSKSGEKEYRLTEKGRTALKEMETYFKEIEKIELLPTADAARLGALLKTICISTDKATAPRSKWAFERMRKMRAENSAPIRTINQLLAELNAFRDDCHLASWRSHNVSAPAWETFTFLWRGEAKTLEELYPKVQLRGNSKEVYADALKDLVTRGWVEEKEGVYQVNAKGRALRDQAEAQTDKDFYAPWSVLSNAEEKELESLLVRARDAVKAS